MHTAGPQIDVTALAIMGVVIALMVAVTVYVVVVNRRRQRAATLAVAARHPSLSAVPGHLGLDLEGTFRGVPVRLQVVRLGENRGYGTELLAQLPVPLAPGWEQRPDIAAWLEAHPGLRAQGHYVWLRFSSVLTCEQTIDEKLTMLTDFARHLAS